MEFELPYYISNGGDGSVSLNPCQSLAEAEKADSEMDEGWGESSAGTIKLKVENKTLFYRDFEEFEGKYQYVWKQVK